MDTILYTCQHSCFQTCYTQVYTSIHSCFHKCFQTSFHTFLHNCLRTCLHTCLHRCLHIFVHICLQMFHIWAKSASPSTKMLQLVKMEILDPSVGVRNDWVQFCPSRFAKFRHLSSHFWRNQNKIWFFEGSQDPLKLKFSDEENLKLEGSRTPPKINIFFWFLQKLLLKRLNFPNLEGQNLTQKFRTPTEGSNISIFTSCSILVLVLADLAHMYTYFHSCFLYIHAYTHAYKCFYTHFLNFYTQVYMHVYVHVYNHV
jgi:hypothetical protein